MFSLVVYVHGLAKFDGNEILKNHEEAVKN